MGLLAHQILRLLYASEPENCLVTGGELLTVMSAAVFFIAVVQTTTRILQGLGKPSYPVKTLAIGIVFKILLNYVLIGIPSINVLGAAYASVACYGIAAVGNVYMVLKLSGTRLRAGSAVVRPRWRPAAGRRVSGLRCACRSPSWQHDGDARRGVRGRCDLCGAGVCAARPFPGGALHDPGRRQTPRWMDRFGGKKA